MGKAIPLVVGLVNNPSTTGDARAHKLLAQLYILNREPAKAKDQIKWLADRHPDSVEVIRLLIQTMDPVQDHDKIQLAYRLLPETTPDQMADKAQVAHEIGNDEETIRLLKLIVAAKPNDIASIITLVRMDQATGHKEDAAQVLQDGLKANPDDPAACRSYRGQLSGNRSPEELDKQAREAIDKNFPDPFSREIRLAQLAVNQNKPDDELDHLKKAEQLQPDNPAVLKGLFQKHYLSTRQFDQAETYLPKLAKADADDAKGELFQLRLALTRADVQAALTAGRQLTADFPEFANSWEGYGEALQLAGQPDVADAQKYLTALEKQPTEHQRGLRHLIHVYVQMGKLDDAKRYIAEGRQKFPGDQGYRDLEVEFELRFGDPDTVLPSLLDAIKKNPDSPRNYSIAADARLYSARRPVRTGQGLIPRLPSMIPIRPVTCFNRRVTPGGRTTSISPHATGVAMSAPMPAIFPPGVAVIKALSDQPRPGRTSNGVFVIGAGPALYMMANKPDLAEKPAPLRCHVQSESAGCSRPANSPVSSPGVTGQI